MISVACRRIPRARLSSGSLTNASVGVCPCEGSARDDDSVDIGIPLFPFRQSPEPATIQKALRTLLEPAGRKTVKTLYNGKDRSVSDREWI